MSTPPSANTATPSDRFELPLAIAPDDIDELGHVNNVVYLRWAQDVATAHWRAAATTEQQDGIAWVALRHEIGMRFEVDQSFLWAAIEFFVELV